MEDLTVSVIIPVYNVEKYLRQCVESVIGQTYRNLEIILVDDGSTDKSSDICDEYKAKDCRIRVLHKMNGGLSDARNTGCSVANGEYVLYLDSDDYWSDPEGIAKLVNRIEITKPDVLSFSYHKFYEETGESTGMLLRAEDMPMERNDKAGQLQFLTDYGLFIASAWNKIIKRTILSNLGFVKGVFSEDIEWCARLMDKAGSLDYLNLDLYCYRQRAGSITKSKTWKNYTDVTDAIEKCAEIYNSSTPELREYYGRYTAYQISTFIAIQAMAKTKPADCIKRVGKYKGILRHYGNSRKVRIMYYGSKCLGMTLWCAFIRGTKGIWNKRRNKI